MMQRRSPRLVDVVLMPLLYYLGARAGVALTIMPEGMAILWPPNSVLLAALIAFRGRRLVLFAVLALGAEVAADWPAFRLSESLLFGLANIAEAMVAHGLLTRWRFDPRLAAPIDLAKFVGAGPLAGALAAACGGAVVYSAFRGPETGYWEFLRIWWFGDALGLLIFTPLILSVWLVPPEGTRLPAALRAFDGLIGLAGLAVLGLLAASRDGGVLGMSVGPVLLLPFVIFVSARFSLVWTAGTVAVVTLSVVSLLTRGHPLFGSLPPRVAVIQAQEFIFIMSLVALGLSALLTQLRTARGEVERVNAELEQRAGALERSNLSLQRAEAEVSALNVGLEARVQERTRELERTLAQVNRLQGLLPMCAWCKKIRDDQDYWHSVEAYIGERAEVQFSHGVCPECLARIVKEGQ